MAEIGDLICYNSAGQMKKTLGLVMDRVYVEPKARQVGDVGINPFKGGWLIQVQWVKEGDRLPREASLILCRINMPDDKRFSGANTGHKWWHEKPWFVTVKN